MEYLVTLGGGWLFWKYVRPNIPWNKVIDGYAYLRSSYQNIGGSEEEEQIFLLNPLPGGGAPHPMDPANQKCMFQIGDNKLQCLSTDLDSSALLTHYKGLSRAPFQSPDIDYIELQYRSEKQQLPDLHQVLKDLYVLKTSSEITIQDVLEYLSHRYPDKFQDASLEDLYLRLTLFPAIIIDPDTSYFQFDQHQDSILLDSGSSLVLKQT